MLPVTGNENFYGVGANFHFNKTIALKVEMERYKVDFDAGAGIYPKPLESR